MDDVAGAVEERGLRAKNDGERFDPRDVQVGDHVDLAVDDDAGVAAADGDASRAHLMSYVAPSVSDDALRLERRRVDRQVEFFFVGIDVSRMASGVRVNCRPVADIMYYSRASIQTDFCLDFAAVSTLKT